MTKLTGIVRAIVAELKKLQNGTQELLLLFLSLIKPAPWENDLACTNVLVILVLFSGY